MGLLDLIGKKKADGKDNTPDNEERVAEQAAKDPDVQEITEEHAQQAGVPKADESAQPLNKEQMENQEKAQESSGSGDSGESQDTEESKSSSLVVKPYEGEKEKGVEEEEEKEDENEESDLESDEDDGFFRRMALGLQKENEDNASKMDGEKSSENKVNISKDDDSSLSILDSSNYKDSSGNAMNLFKQANPSTLDKVQKKINLTSSLTSIASSGVGVFEGDGLLGKKLGVGNDTSKKLGQTSAGLSLASDALSLASGGISIYKDIQDMKKNDEFTTDAEKTKQRLSLASDVVGMGSTSTSMGRTISQMAGGEKTATAFGAATNTLNAVGKALDIAGTAVSLKETNTGMKKLKTAMNDDSSSEEFKKMAGVAMQAHKLQKTSAGFSIAKSSASFISNLTGAAKKFGDLAGVDESSTLGKVFKYAGKAGSYISYLGTGLGLIGSVVNKFQKSKRSNSDIDSFIDTPGLKNKINSETNYKLNDKQTRKAAMKVLGYKSSDEMYSAILMNYAATIRNNAESGEEKDKYRMLIESLGFKLQGNSNLPSVEAIAKKLSASA